MKTEVGTKTAPDMATTAIRRVGFISTLIAASLSEGCASMLHGPAHGPFNPPPATAPLAPAPATFREAQRAFDLAERMGFEHSAYIDSTGQRHTSMKGMRELSLDNGPRTRGAFVDNLDATFTHNGAPRTFKMGAFSDWQEQQGRELLSRNDLQQMLKTPGSGVLFTVEGNAFFVKPFGDQAHFTKLAPVQPFFPGESPR